MAANRYHPRRHRVAVLVRDGVMPMELGLVHQLFGQARSIEGEPLYDVVTCGLRAGEVRTNADFPILVPHGPEALAAADTVIVPASHHDDLGHPVSRGVVARAPGGFGDVDDRHLWE